MRIKNIAQKDWFVPLVSFVLAIILINPLGHYAINDDWDFYTHVKNFRQGDFIKNSLIDSSFVLQGLLGTLWSSVFGFNYNSLRVLTTLVTVAFILGLVRLMQEAKLEHRLIIIGSISIIFNSFVLMSSVSFMTEMYFLCLVIWSIYFLVKYINLGLKKYFILAMVLSSLSILVRQIGLLVAPVFLLIIFCRDLADKKLEWKKYIYGALILIACSVINFLWPQYPLGGVKAINFFNQSKESISNAKWLYEMIYYAIPYFGFILIPIGMGIFCKLGIKQKVISVALVLLIFNSFYSVNIFKFGNVLYPEALMIKNNYMHHFTVLDNIAFKIFLNSVCLLSFFSVILGVINLRKMFNQVTVWTLFMIGLSLTLPTLAYLGFFDRYLINGMAVLVVFLLVILSRVPDIHKIISLKVSYVFLIYYCFYNLFLVQDFILTTKTEWKNAENLKTVKNVGNKIFLSDTYTRFNSVFVKANNASLNKAMPSGIDYQCYVQRKAVKDSKNSIYQFIDRLNSYPVVVKNFDNPGVFQEKNLPGFREITKDKSKIVFTEQIYPFVEAVTGNKVFIVTYCNY